MRVHASSMLCVQALAAQWVMDAVPAYNLLVEYVQTLPMQFPEQGKASLPFP